MPIAYVASASATVATGTSLTVGKPAGVVEDDVLVAVVEQTNLAGTGIGTPAAPAGWTGLTQDAVSIRCTARAFWKQAGGAEAADYAFTCTATNGGSGMAAAISAYSGADPANPVWRGGDDIPDEEGQGPDASGSVAFSTRYENFAAVLLGALQIQTTGTNPIPAVFNGGATKRVEDGRNVANHRHAVAIGEEAIATWGNFAADRLTVTWAAAGDDRYWTIILKPAEPVSASEVDVGGTSRSYDPGGLVVPAGTGSGDLLLSLAAIGTGAAAHTMAGWTKAGYDTAADRWVAYWRRADGSGTDLPTPGGEVFLVALRDVTDDPIAVSGNHAEDSTGTGVTVPGPAHTEPGMAYSIALTGWANYGVPLENNPPWRLVDTGWVDNLTDQNFGLHERPDAASPTGTLTTGARPNPSGAQAWGQQFVVIPGGGGLSTVVGMG